jgi:hypothetical protein
MLGQTGIDLGGAPLWLVFSGAALSCIGALVIVVVYICFVPSSRRSHHLSLVIGIAGSDIVASIPIILGLGQVLYSGDFESILIKSTYSIALRWTQHLGFLASICWTSSISVSLLLLLWRPGLYVYRTRSGALFNFFSLLVLFILVANCLTGVFTANFSGPFSFWVSRSYLQDTYTMLGCAIVVIISDIVTVYKLFTCLKSFEKYTPAVEQMAIFTFVFISCWIWPLGFAMAYDDDRLTLLPEGRRELALIIGLSAEYSVASIGWVNALVWGTRVFKRGSLAIAHDSVLRDGQFAFGFKSATRPEPLVEALLDSN